ncbi:menaquinone biosynthesis protein [Actinocatenispora sera]|uniref:menaquinone biosynthetic enzyme MqnA/MqnD family protein n=1 Tax=Actinocatenispora sera TaxID=390989 RepID=UPI0004C330AB|nr:menaquinone biosynthesis protein [Actinocatenispora sera]
MSVLRRPRVGHIEFLNCLPIYWGLMRSGTLADVDLTKAPPDVLNDQLVAGELDIAPISLVEFLRHADDLLVLRDIAVTSDGPVLSVNIVHKRPLAELDGRRVALGSTSRTGVLLAQLLLAERYGVRPEYVRGAPDLDVLLADADAAVVIGDVALRAMYEGDHDGLTVTDLGSAWKDWTGLPMVFAVWAARRDYAAANPGLVKDVHQAFLRSTALARTELDAVVDSAVRWEPFDKAILARYYQALEFDLSDRKVAGLREFARRAAAAGAVPALPADGPTFFADA